MFVHSRVTIYSVLVVLFSEECRLGMCLFKNLISICYPNLSGKELEVPNTKMIVMIYLRYCTF